LPAVEDDSFCFAPIVLSDGGTAAPVPVLSERTLTLDAPLSQLIEIVVGDVIIRLDGAVSSARVAEIVRAIGSGA
jgi:transposase